MTGSDGVLLGFVAAALAALHAGALFGSRVYFSGELTYISQPWLTVTAEQLQRGQAPLWNPYGLFGMPWLGCMQTGLFYPANLLFHLFSFGRGLAWHFFSSSMLAALWTFLWLRRRRFAPLPALAGSVATALGGCIAGQLEFPHQVATIVQLPALFLFLGRPLLLGLALGVAFLAGYPPKWAAMAAVLGALACLRGALLPESRRTLIKTLASFGVAAGLSAAVLFPGLEFLRASARGAEGVPIEERTYYSLTPIELTAFIHPELTRRLGFLLEPRLPYKEEATWITDTGEKKTFTFVGEHTDLVRDPTGIRYHSWNGFYLGACASLVALAGFAALASRSAARAFGLALGGTLYLLLVLGKNTPASLWLWEHLAPLRYVRGPDRFLWLHLIATPVLVAEGVQGIRRLRGGRVWACAAAVAMSAELLATAWGYYPAMDSGFFDRRGPFVEFLQGRLGTARYLQFKAVPIWAYVDRKDRSEDYRRYRRMVFDTFRQMNYALGGSVFHFGCVSPEKWLPLVPSPSSQVIAEMAKQEFGDFDKLIPYLKWTGIRFIADWSKGPKKTALIPRGNHLWNVWESPESVAPAYWVPAETAGLLRGSIAQAPTHRGLRPWEHVIIREDRIMVRGRAPEDGAAFVADPFYPGWELYVNGKKTAFERALGAFLSFPAPEGKVEALLVYRPLSWRLGASLTVVALAGLAFVGLRKALGSVS